MENSKFSKISLIISGIALVTSIVVLVISFSSNKGSETESTKHSGNVSIDTTGKANIAYVNLDTILAE
jgi:hypothetical protein